MCGRATSSSTQDRPFSRFSLALFGVPASGNAGDVRATANVLELTDHGQITASTDGSGAGGSAELTVGTLALSRGSAVLAGSTRTGTAGDIRVAARTPYA